MLDKKKYPRLYAATQGTVKCRRDWLSEAIKARDLCALLPDEIKAMDISTADYSCTGTLSLTIKNTNGTVTILRRLGIQGLKPQVSKFSKERFFTEGRGKLPDGSFLSIHVTDITEPEGCQVVTKTTTREEYELVCEGKAETPEK